MLRPERKNSFELEPALLETHRPIIRKAIKNKEIIPQSSEDNCILNKKLKGLIRSFFELRTEKIEKLFNRKLWI